MTPAVVSVSVVIPARDDATELDRCLALLAVQSEAPFEIVVVDNGSRDDTAAVARSWGAVVVHEPHPGIPAAAAAGYDAARGTVIARLDADSRPGPHWVRTVVEVFTGEGAPDAVTGVGTFTDLRRGGTVVCVLYLGAYYVLGRLALGHTALWGSSMAMRRTAWEAVRGTVERYDAEVHDDMDLAFALGPRRTIVRDRRMHVGVSARSLRTARRRRLRRATRTLRRNWAMTPPWDRWKDHLTRS